MPGGIAILGWGSLLWGSPPAFRDQHGPWQFDGPELPLEFSRVSQRRRGALTLVIDPIHGSPCPVAYAISRRAHPEDAIRDLWVREGTTRRNIGYLFADGSAAQARDPVSRDAIRAWAAGRTLDVVVWADLPSNFAEEVGEPFGIDAALAYLQALGPEARTEAIEYLQRAPDFVATPLLRGVTTQSWFRG